MPLKEVMWRSYNGREAMAVPGMTRTCAYALEGGHFGGGTLFELLLAADSGAEQLTGQISFSTLAPKKTATASVRYAKLKHLQQVGVQFKETLI